MVLNRALDFLPLLVLLALQHGIVYGGFARTSGAQFMVDGQPFYANGFNAYWLMYTAEDPTQIDKVSSAFQQAASYGMTVVRTWAFRDGGYMPLQISPGNYNEDMFKALDFVISEAKKHGVYLILSFVNHWADYGGRYQYVQWAKSQGQDVSSDDDFYRNELIKEFYKNHIKAVLTRWNTITGVSYMNDPTIFAWELINEPRCQSDLSGSTLQLQALGTNVQKPNGLLGRLHLMPNITSTMSSCSSHQQCNTVMYHTGEKVQTTNGYCSPADTQRPTEISRGSRCHEL